MGLIGWRRFSSIPNFREKQRAIARQRERFVPTRTEFSARPIRKQVTKKDFILDVQAINNVFTVPVGNTLFIHSAYLNVETRQAAKATSLIRIPALGSSDQDILQCTCASSPDSNSIVMLFPGGLRIEAGSVIQHISSSPFATSSTRMGFFGTLEEETEEKF